MKYQKARRAILGIITAAAVTSTAMTAVVPVTVIAATTTSSSTGSSGSASSGTGSSGTGSSGMASSGSGSSGSTSSGTDSSGTASSDAGTPPEKPDGSSSDGQGGPGGDGQAPSGEAPSGDAPSGAPGGGGSSAVTEWDAATEISEDTETDGETYDSTGTDENAVHVTNGAKVVLNDPTITRTSQDSAGGDNSSFYGVGAAVLTTDGTTYINGGTISTEGDGAAGAFSYDSGTTYIAGTTISTTGNTAGGIHVAGGGTLYAWNVNATTQGESSAAIRSDRGGGTMVVDGGTYTSNGTGSPAVYTTADISINDATLTANGSEGVCIEGLNALRLFDCDLTSNMSDDDQNDSTWSVILYQSMSGDSEVGNSSYYMTGGSLNSENGGLFYTTNTESDFYLNNVAITQADDCEYFLRATGNSNERGWGTTGENGADCDFTAVQQTMNGDVIWDSISQLDFYMTDGSTLTGAVLDDETYAGDGGDGYCTVYVDDSSTWNVTGDSTVTNLYSAGTIVDLDGKTVSIVGSDGTSYVDGDSEYTITVTGTYSTDVDLSGAVAAVSWSDYEVAVPDEITAVTTSDEITTSATDAASTSGEDVTSSDDASSQTESEAVSSADDTDANDTAKTGTSSASTVIIVVAALAAAACIAGVVVIKRKKK